MGWTIVASIAAAVSAGFAALSAFLMWRQGASKIKVDISNEVYTDHPQNIFFNDGHMAIVRADVQNLSSHPLVLADCEIKLGDEKFVALEKGMDFDFTKTLTMTAENNTSKDITKSEQFDKLPIELTPFQFVRLLIPFPNFKNTDANVLNGKIIFTYNLNKKIKKDIIIHKISVIS